MTADNTMRSRDAHNCNNGDALFVYLRTEVQRRPFAETEYCSTNYICSRIVENAAQTDLRTIFRHCAYCRYERSGRRPRVTPANTAAVAARRGPRREKETSASTSPSKGDAPPSPLVGEPWQPQRPLSPPLGGRNLHPFPVMRRSGGERCAFTYTNIIILLL